MLKRTSLSHKVLRELPAAKKSTTANFDVVLRAVRIELKLDWCFYEEALEGVVRAGAQGGDVTPWLVNPWSTVVVDQLRIAGSLRWNNLSKASPR
jgi:hypothetical protein